jgi:hypothetical protein
LIAGTQQPDCKCDRNTVTSCWRLTFQHYWMTNLYNENHSHSGVQ